MDRVAARAITDYIKIDGTKLQEAIKVAYFRRAWEALGYGSWDVYCKTEFAGTRLRFPRDERIKEVYGLREAGLSTRAIAAAIGVSDGTVRNDLDAGCAKLRTCRETHDYGPGRQEAPGEAETET